MHIGYLGIMFYAGCGYLAYFNIFSILLYFTCGIFFCKPSHVALTFYLSYFEIIVFSTLSGSLITNGPSFSLLTFILIPLACLMKFWQDSLYQKSLFHAGKMVVLLSIVSLVNCIKPFLYSDLGIFTLNPQFYEILNVYNLIISLVTLLITGIAFTSVSVHENKKVNDRFETLAGKLVIALSQSVEAKDQYTKGHSSRVAKYSKMIAERLCWSEEKLKIVYYAGLLHDVGKIGISDTIINKKGGLTDEEYAIIKDHPIVGERILKDLTEMPELMLVAKHHHERFDGRGYPDKLKGHDIPEIARLVGVADTYDAMTSNRSYRNLMPQAQVIDQMENGIGTQFDPKFAEVMLEIIREDKNYTMHE